MQDGLIVEQGSHHDLMAANHIYYDLVKRQQIETEDSETSETTDVQDVDNIEIATVDGQLIDGKSTLKCQISIVR